MLSLDSIHVSLYLIIKKCCKTTLTKSRKNSLDLEYEDLAFCSLLITDQGRPDSNVENNDIRRQHGFPFLYID